MAHLSVRKWLADAHPTPIPACLAAAWQGSPPAMDGITRRCSGSVHACTDCINRPSTPISKMKRAKTAGSRDVLFPMAGSIYLSQSSDVQHGLGGSLRLR